MRIDSCFRRGMPRRTLIGSLVVLAFVVACSKTSGKPGLLDSRASEGGACLETSDCQAGLYCSRSGSSGPCGTCAPGSAEGAACPSFPSDPTPPCGLGLVCVIPDPFSGGRCAKPAILADGAECSDCTSERKACACAPTSECGGPKQTCIPTPAPGSAAAGQPCAHETECAPTLHCSGGVCIGLGLGAACNEDEGQVCAIGLACGFDGKCITPLPDGAACHNHGKLGNVLSECAGACHVDDAHPETGTCIALVPKGGACAVDADCVRGMVCGLTEKGGDVCMSVANGGEPCDDETVCVYGYECSNGACRSSASLKCSQ